MNQRDIAILMGCSAESIRNVPELFRGESGPILSRIGAHNLIPISDILASDADTFIRAILGYIVDKTQVSDKVQALKGKVNETLNPELFPFTQEGVEALKQVIKGAMTPRNITQRMTDAAGKAFLMKKAIITSEVVGG